MDSSSGSKDMDLLAAMESGAAHNEDEMGGEGKTHKVELLRARIDEQGQLICFLKRRADDQMTANKELSSRFEDLAMSKEDGDTDIKMLRDHCEMLENRFDELAENHDEMIKIKDEYKMRCKDLTKRNAQLEEENHNIFSGKLNSKDMEIEKIGKELDDSKKKFDKLSSEHEELVKKFNTSKASMTTDNKRLYQELGQTRIKLDKAEEIAASLTSTQKSNLSTESENYTSLQREKADLLKEVMSRGRLVQEKQNTIDMLQSRLAAQTCEMTKLKEDITHKEQNLSINKRVNALMKENGELVESYEALKDQYKGLRDHSNKLLAKEKELNMILSCGRNSSIRDSRRNKSELTLCQREPELENDDNADI